MTKKRPAAFMSYVHSDDQYGNLTTLRERLSQEVQVQTGHEFTISQDIKDIQWGESWRQRIDQSLDEITFLIPIITPSFFNSEPCRAELERFVEREKKLCRYDLILPVYFVDTPLLNDAELRAKDALAEIIASRQYADWRELRFEPFTNPQVGKTMAQLAVQIRNALLGIETTEKAPAKIPAARSAEGTNMVAKLEDELLEKVQALPPNKQQEALKFLDTLANEATSKPNGTGVDRRPIWEVVDEINAELPEDTWENVPTDGSINLDHYLYGAPKQQS